MRAPAFDFFLVFSGLFALLLDLPSAFRVEIVFREEFIEEADRECNVFARMKRPARIGRYSREHGLLVGKKVVNEADLVSANFSGVSQFFPIRRVPSERQSLERDPKQDLLQEAPRWQLDRLEERRHAS